jgi:hypothetical protein
MPRGESLSLPFPGVAHRATIQTGQTRSLVARTAGSWSSLGRIRAVGARQRGQNAPMTERYDHRDADARAADSQEDEVIDGPVLDGADELQAEATRAVAEEDTTERG